MRVSRSLRSLANYLLSYVQILFLYPVKKAERNFEIAARTLCLRVCGTTPRFTAAVKSRFPGNISVLEFFSIESSLKAISSDYGSNKERNVHLEMRNLKQTGFID